MSAKVTGFDQLAQQYDALWNNTAIGISQRKAVWRWVDPLFHKGDRILDLGCGTGADATHFQQRGINVQALDASAEMVRIAKHRGIDVEQRSIENIGSINIRFDGVISNFGALNCVEQPVKVAQALGRLVRPGGKVAICVMGLCCLWEFCYYLLHGNLRKAVRRFEEKTPASIGINVSYPSHKQWLDAFGENFTLLKWVGIGLCVPPSYVREIRDSTVLRLAEIDRHIAQLPGMRALADHQLLIFERL